ncbi:MAG TPA: chromosome segregation protein SMC [Vicinamibacterales bacterium]|nr:chromosome segregation protein SMC [Vicinamibacterales bacterium]
MRLSRLHINGFKSFPDRAELGFDDGVTAIVGPNGCGKSNVVDAITWVLGEQSAKSLRGERMEDVIFNGSDARKPTAAAEVRLKLTQVAQAAMAAATALPADPIDDVRVDDEPPALLRDIEIGRRLYRSGESEYLIDGEVCRLRDVHDLLMDSGLGVKAYAVIEQGKIGQILSSRPAERRMLIEEAAGVTKYKSRRRAAELKLEAAQGNLTRIDDIIFEVEKQRGALRRQAARARRYKRLREELRRWEQVQFAHKYEALAKDIDAADARLAGARAREAAAAAHVAELETALEGLRLGLAEAEAGATATREQAHGRELEIGRRQQQIQFDRQQIDDLALQAESFAAEARELDARREPARLAIAASQEAALRAAQALADAAQLVAERETDYSRALAGVQAVEQESDETRAAVLAATTTIMALRQARDNAAAVRDRVAAERERLDVEHRELSAELDRVQRDHDAAQQSATASRAALDALAQTHAAAASDLAARRADRERATQALATLQQNLAGRSARLRSLEELDASRATFGDAARFLLSETGAALARHGAVADHLVVERSFERAVDALFGDLLQHVLVDRTDDATRGLSLLTERSAGRCGFLVLEETRGDVPADAPLVVPPGSRPLASVVRATGPHAAAIARLIGRALIVDSIETARALARTVSVPVATTSGEVFRGAWLVQGGSRQDVRGILESRAEMLSLRDEVAAMEAEAATMTSALAELDAAIATAGPAVSALIARLHDDELALVGLTSRAQRAAEDLHRLARRLDVVTTDKLRADEEGQATEQRRDEAAAAIITHETGHRDAESRLSGVLARLQSAREAAEARLRLVTESRTEQATLTERAGALETDLARLIEAARDLDARLASRNADIQRTEVRREELRTAVADTERQLDDDIAALERLRGEMRTLDEQVITLRGQFSGRDHEIRGARHALEGVRDEVMQSEVAKARATADLAHLETQCSEAVGASLDEVVAAVAGMEERGELQAPGRRLAAASAPDADEAEDGEEAAASDAAEAGGSAFDAAQAVQAGGSDGLDAMTPDQVIADLRKKIERLGPVNMMAIEQFDELESRHTFLTTQRKDLLDSIAQTGEAIRRIDKTTRERFAEAFAVVNTNFEKTFTTLFGGGRAGLVLIDQENEQESGIDIIAQPPGKRLQNVQLLSGGEKALTAMALMFAIFKYRPSPFCLLDEIDAPLDDANIGRFVEMLQGMQDHTQFILITHNRKTMEIANRLYGVTMEEPGVSKLISLQLN